MVSNICQKAQPEHSKVKLSLSIVAVVINIDFTVFNFANIIQFCKYFFSSLTYPFGISKTEKSCLQTISDAALKKNPIIFMKIAFKNAAKNHNGLMWYVPFVFPMLYFLKRQADCPFFCSWIHLSWKSFSIIECY